MSGVLAILTISICQSVQADSLKFYNSSDQNIKIKVFTYGKLAREYSSVFRNIKKQKTLNFRTLDDITGVLIIEKKDNSPGLWLYQRTTYKDGDEGVVVTVKKSSIPGVKKVKIGKHIVITHK